ncbi:MAG: hypothetical protein A3F73_06330 [Gallionellales bacterium RIFCSPLOWO2_12_FULL_59_22]|nr:MAG: hypothetical protein A3H99_11215 [Gallionellales bacterium RIFCSPLOWO2_02_FULL_59_110]OGT13420.1 MAG: hypothetical protein A3F73_06330 [Gallionellales bacterium RIFCSPLOWO2_12_FULL_59_22]
MKTMLHRQRGATLIVALIMLVLLTLFAVTSFNLGTGSLHTVGNAQSRNEAMAAAQQAVEEAVSTTRLFQSPSTVIINGDAECEGGAPNTKCVDVNGDDNPDITVRLDPPPVCIITRPILNSEIDPNISNDAGCSIQTGQAFAVAGAATGNSLCADSVWEVIAVATDSQTGAQYTVTQGLGVRVANDDIASACP